MRGWDAVLGCRHRVSDFIDQELPQRLRSLLEADLELLPGVPAVVRRSGGRP